MSVRIKGHDYVTVSELADSLGVSHDTIYIWVKRKQITPFIRKFGKYEREALVCHGYMSKEDADSRISHRAMLFDVDTKKPEVKRKMVIVDGCSYYTSADLSRLWGVTKTTIARWIKGGYLKPDLSLPINSGRKKHLFHEDTEKPIVKGTDRYPNLISGSELARRWGVSTSAISKMIERGIITPAVKESFHVFFPPNIEKPAYKFYPNKIAKLAYINGQSDSLKRTLKMVRDCVDGLPDQLEDLYKQGKNPHYAEGLWTAFSIVEAYLAVELSKLEKGGDDECN